MSADSSASSSRTVFGGFLESLVNVLIGDDEAAFLDAMAYVMITAGFLMALSATGLGIQAPYGRYSPRNCGLGVESRTAWFSQELPSFVIPVLLLLFSNGRFTTVLANTLLLGFFVIHYFQRTFVFSFLIRGGKATHLILVVLAFIFCCCNGYMQARYLTHYAVYSKDWMHDSRFLIGSVLFFAGFIINIHSDTILRNLRKPGEKGYKIPRGGMFDYISGAKFFGEILEWTGFAIACWSLQGLAFAFYTLCVIGPRAWQHHKFYLEKFDDYPKSRKALIPFIL